MLLFITALSESDGVLAAIWPWEAYQLTSIEQSVEQMIEVAATLLFEQPNKSAHKVLPHTVVLPCRLVVRATSRSES